MRVLKGNRIVTICKIAGLALLLSGILSQPPSQAIDDVDPRYAVAEYVRDNVLGGEYGNRTIWISAWPVDSSHEARSLDPTEPTIELPYEGWMVMIDDAPEANFAHDVRWLFVRVDLGGHTTPEAYTMPPRVFDEENNEVPVSCLEGATEVLCTELEPLPPGPMIAIDSLLAIQAAAEKECLYAVLISGGAYPGINYERYRTNLRSMYSILLSQGYPKINIDVYYADGDPLDLDDADGDGNDSTGSDVTDSADEATIRARIQDLCDDLDPVTDYLFVYVSNHGSANGAICLYDFDSSGSLEADEEYSPAEMGADTEDCQVCRLFMLHDQCFSGAFLPLATDGDHDNTTVYAAATDSESSWGREYLDWWEDLDHANDTLEDMHQDVVDNGGLRSTADKDEVDEANDQVKLGDCCENNPPTADADGPYEKECEGATTTVALDGTGSSDPDGDPLTYAWTTDCPGGSFDDPTSATPMLTVDSMDECSLECNVDLTVTDSGGLSDSSSSTVTILDTIPPVISCNAPSTIIPPDAPISFTATATDDCDSDPSVEIADFDCYKFTKKGKRIDKTESCVVEVVGDTINILDSGGVGDMITWTVWSTDGCGNVREAQCMVEVVNPGNP